MNYLKTLQNIKSHTDANSIPDGLIHISQNLLIDALVSNIREHIREDFYIVSNAQSGAKETVLHYKGENYTLDFSAYLYPHFAVVQTLKRLLADKYSCFLHQTYLKQEIYALLIIENSTLNDFISKESFWFDKSFARLQGGFDGFSKLNAVQQTNKYNLGRYQKKRELSAKEKKENDFNLDYDFARSEHNKNHTMNGFPVALMGFMVFIFITVSYFGYSILSKGSMKYASRSWKETFTFILPAPNKIAKEELTKYVGKLVTIPEGSFQMGTEANDKIDNAFPIHEVTLQQFEMMETEITFAQWDACVADGGCTTNPDDLGWGREDHPVMNVSIDDIVDQYIPWLYEKTGYQFELPSESQWEYAALGGKNTIYAFGDTVICGYGNYGRFSHHKGYNTVQYCSNDKGTARTKVVKNYPANAYGLYDMYGNVAEYVADQYIKNYINAPIDGSARSNITTGDVFTGPGKSIWATIRGGCFRDKKQIVNARYRNDVSDANQSEEVGFRLVLNSEE